MTLCFGDVIPIVRLRSMGEFKDYLASNEAIVARRFDDSVMKANSAHETWVYPGYSELCGQYVLFEVDMQASWLDESGQRIANIRERLACPVTGLNNRQRLMASLLKQRIAATRSSLSIYLMEEVTPFYRWCAEHLTCELQGSEYLGPQYAGGTIVNGIRHEDAAALSLSDQSTDIIVSNDVFEHVPFPERSFSECLRALRTGGVMLMTIPFAGDTQASVMRAEMKNGVIDHLLPPEYHGNPVSEEGSLVFTCYGWDVLDMAKRVGFSDAWVDVYHEPAFGHIGHNLMLFHLTR